MLIEIFEKRRYFGIQVAGMEPQREEGPSDRLKCVRLNDWPLLNAFTLLAVLQEKSDLGSLIDSSVESGDLEDFELISAVELLLSRREDRAILKRIDQILQILPAFWREKDEGFPIADEDDEFIVLGIKKAIIIDLAAGESKEEPIEEIRGA